MFIGIDQSIKNTGIVILNVNGKVIKSITVSFSDVIGNGRLLEIYAYFYKLASNIEYKYCYWGLEDYAFNSKFSREKLGELRACIELALLHNSVSPIIIPIKTHRKKTFGNGNLSKERCAELVGKLYGYKFITLDEYDAFSIAYSMYLDYLAGRLNH